MVLLTKLILGLVAVIGQDTASLESYFEVVYTQKLPFAEFDIEETYPPLDSFDLDGRKFHSPVIVDSCEGNCFKEDQKLQEEPQKEPQKELQKEPQKESQEEPQDLNSKKQTEVNESVDPFLKSKKKGARVDLKKIDQSPEEESLSKLNYIKDSINKAKQPTKHLRSPDSESAFTKLWEVPNN